MAQLKAHIGREGPIRVDAFIQSCLHDAQHGYYRTQEALGADGDFVTAPEISQVFGELIGLWCAVVWQQMGAPSAVRLIELGPGRGTLMRDALRAARIMPAFLEAVRVHLVETNAVLAKQQRAALENQTVPITWANDLESNSLGKGATIVIANEFIDALPVTQWVLHEGDWRERAVDLDAAGELTFGHGAVEPDLRLPQVIATAPQDGDVFESRDSVIEGWMERIADLGAPLAALIIDYGHFESGFGDTLQAVRAHRYLDPLEAPGQADLTAQVDFAALKAVAVRHGLCVDGPTTQAQFLGTLGIAERASRLMATNPAKAAEIESAIARLMAPTGMGSRFKAVGLRNNHLEPLPGFAA